MTTNTSDKCATPLAPYVYSPIVDNRHIRLLQLNDAEFDDDIVCSLVQKPLDDLGTAGVKYIALSYVWGDISNTKPAVCDGKLISINSNLHLFLRHLRRTGINRIFTKPQEQDSASKPATLYMWADALCINQNDDRERTHQVRLMQDIYKRADLVVAWLGENSDALVRALDLTVQIEKAIQSHSSSANHHDDYYNLSHANLESLGLPKLKDGVWEDLHSLLSIPWFSRIWVIQELLMATKFGFLIGDAYVKLELLYFAREFARSALYGQFTQIKPQNSPSLHTIRDLGGLKYSWQNDEKLKILDLLWRTKNFEASDLRDKAFALVGLASDLDSAFIDYSHTTTDAMLLRLSRHLLNIQHDSQSMYPRLSNLSYSQALPRTIDLPSWVTNWTSNRISMSPLTFHFPDDSPDPELVGSPTRQIASISGKCLNVFGRRCDRIKSAVNDHEYRGGRVGVAWSVKERRSGTSGNEIDPDGQPMTNFVESFEIWCKQLQTWEKFVQDLECYPTQEPLADVLWRSLMFDDERVEDVKNRNALTHFYKTNDRWKRLRNPKAVEFSIPNFCRSLRNPEPLNFSLLRARYLGISLYSYLNTAFISWATYILLRLGLSVRSFLWSAAIIILWLLTVFVSAFLSIAISRISFAMAGIRFAKENTRWSIETRVFSQKYATATTGRTLASTTLGYVGWVPERAKESDELWFFDGCRLPFLLRPREVRPGEEQTHQLIGDCYIHGLMSIKTSSAIEAETCQVQIT